MFTEETLKIIVPAFTGILGLFIGYFLKWSEYERQRRDELADRAHNRKLEYRDKRIAEAQECLNVFWEATSMMANIETKALFQRDADVVKSDSLKVLPLINPPLNKLMSLALLENPVLADATEEFSVLLHSEHKEMIELLRTIHRNEAVDEEAIYARISEFALAAARYNGEIQFILAQLASET